MIATIPQPSDASGIKQTTCDFVVTILNAELDAEEDGDQTLAPFFDNVSTEFVIYASDRKEIVIGEINNQEKA